MWLTSNLQRPISSLWQFCLWSKDGEKCFGREQPGLASNQTVQPGIAQPTPPPPLQQDQLEGKPTYWVRVSSPSPTPPSPMYVHSYQTLYSLEAKCNLPFPQPHASACGHPRGIVCPSLPPAVTLPSRPCSEATHTFGLWLPLTRAPAPHIAPGAVWGQPVTPTVRPWCAHLGAHSSQHSIGQGTAPRKWLIK